MTLMFVNGLLEAPIRWLGKAVFGITYDYSVSGSGSGDNTFAYLTVFLNFILAVVLCVLWTVLDKNRKEYNKPFYWFLTAIRFFLFAAMTLYGFVKIFQIQFQPPSLTSLLQPLGDFSPMGLAWTYMGFSKGFGMFAGLMELLGGVLLVNRRTATLGALVVAGVMSQVAMMNLMFDIPVKLFSIHLVIMAIILFLTDSKRFLNVFVKNKPADRHAFYHPVTSPSYHNIIGKIKTVGLLLIVIGGCVLGYLGELNISDRNHRPALYGIWETETVIKNNDTLLPLTTDKQRWRYFIVQRKGYATVKTMDDGIIRFKHLVDSTGLEMRLIPLKKDKDTFLFKMDKPKTSLLRLNGTMGTDAYIMTLKQKSIDSFTLMNTGFNWINERPNNQ